MIGECNYGGRITDEFDKRVLHALLQDFIGEHVLQFGYQPVRKGTETAADIYRPDRSQEFYVLPQGNNDFGTYLDKIQAMPQEEPPHLFGFHPNADISKNIRSASVILN